MIRLAKLFSDGMVLQRELPIRVWGFADADEEVSIRFDGEFLKTKANRDGKWFAELAPRSAGGPHKMNVGGIILNDILIGDVWVCSGQSNMELPMSRVAWVYPDEMKLSDNEIRQFLVPRSYRFDSPGDDFTGGSWEAAAPETLPRFYAASYFFAKELKTKYGIPIGLINSAAGGSTLAAWMSHSDEPIPYRCHEDYLATVKTDSELISGWMNEINKADAGPREHAWVSVNPMCDWSEHPELCQNGAFWFKNIFTVPEHLADKSALLLLGCIRDADTAYINGKLVGETSYQYPPRRYSVPEGLLKKGENILTVRVLSQRGTGGFVPEKPYKLEIDGEEIGLEEGWHFQTGAVASASMHEPVMFEKVPTALWNAMLAPAVPYTLRGVIWYQGESDTHHPAGYAEKFGRMVSDWRQRWNLGDFPFIFAQISHYEPMYLPQESLGWAELREQQRLCVDFPNTAMAITYDIGEQNDLHPTNKRDVGLRLALAARLIAYNDDIIDAEGSEYIQCKLTSL